MSAVVVLIRFRGHFPREGYDVHDARDETETNPTQLHGRIQGRGVRLVLDEGKTVAAARDLDLTESSLRNWVEQARADRTHGKTGLTTAEREELARLRKRITACPGGARNPEKSGGLLREAEPMRFIFIAAKKAEHTVSILCR